MFLPMCCFSAGTFFCLFSIFLDIHASVAAAVTMVVPFLLYLPHAAIQECVFLTPGTSKKNQIKSRSEAPRGLALTMLLACIRYLLVYNTLHPKLGSLIKKKKKATQNT